MILSLLGLILLLASKKINSIFQKNRSQMPKGLVGGIAIFMIASGLLFSTVKQINAGYVGVQTLFGKVQKNILHSGLNVVNPLVKVIDVDVRTQNYTMSVVTDEGEKSGDDAIKVLTKDGLEVSIDLSVLYRVNEQQAPFIIKSIGEDFKYKIVRPIARTEIRDNAVYYDAVELYSVKRQEFQNKITAAIEREFSKRGLVLENILVRNISLPKTVKEAIESKINAEQESQKMQLVLTKEKQEADRKRVEAQGIADYQDIISKSLTAKQLEYEQIKAYREIATSQNAKVLIMPEKNNVIVNP
jgi:regulator of protease activity HflC (stomatin/prohibitin superfamily)